jgi:hypothetical protein
MHRNQTAFISGRTPDSGGVEDYAWFQHRSSASAYRDLLDFHQ